MHHRSAVTITGLAVALTATALGAAGAAAQGPEVIRRGSCSAAADWKLKVGAEDRNRLETQLEIEDGPRNATWRLVVKLNGTQVVSVVRQANAVGDVRLDRVVQGRPGPDTVSFTATTGGQTCSGRATL